MTTKERYKKAGWKIEMIYDTDDAEWEEYSIEIGGFNLEDNISFATEAEAWAWVEDNFPLPDIEAIKQKWQKRLTLYSGMANNPAYSQSKINMMTAKEMLTDEFLSDLGEK